MSASQAPTKTIPLSRGLVALVDAEDYDRLVAMGKWCALKATRPPGRFYAIKQPSRLRGGAPIYMHRVIAGVPAGVQVDHRNHDGLDNRRENLRPATQSQNNGNFRKRPGRRFKGVYMRPGCRTRPWAASLSGKAVGYFSDEEEAARAYDAAARAKWGEFAFINFPGEFSHPALLEEAE